MIYQELVEQDQHEVEPAAVVQHQDERKVEQRVVQHQDEHEVEWRVYQH